MGFIANLAVRHQLKKHGYKGNRALLPLSAIRRAVVLFDANDAELNECVKIAEDFFSGRGIEFKPMLLDMGKTDVIFPGKRQPVTFLKKELTIFGTLPGKTARELKKEQTDLFICLVDSEIPAVRCISGIIPATFSIGRSSWTGSPFLMLMTNPDEPGGKGQTVSRRSAECLRSINDCLKKVVR